MKKFSTTVRVRYQETDAMGVVYYANYLVWFEIVRTEYLRSLGFPYKEIESRGAYLMVAEAHCEYLAPARYDDVIEIQTWISSVKNCSLAFEYNLFLEKKLISKGRTNHVFVNRDGKPVKVPADLRPLLTSAA